LLTDWHNFYMITGTAAATLMGLLFVVTTLIAGVERNLQTLDAGISAFNTPNVVHLCAVLLLSGILSAPWASLVALRLVLAPLAAGAVLYLLVVLWRMWHVPNYSTPLRDWLWYLALPLAAYLIVVYAVVTLAADAERDLYLIGGAMLLLLFLAIRNAWDLVTYFAVAHSQIARKNRK
jgi:hypothetical protein